MLILHVPLIMDSVVAVHPQYEPKFPLDPKHPRLEDGMCKAAAKIATTCTGTYSDTPSPCIFPP